MITPVMTNRTGFSIRRCPNIAALLLGLRTTLGDGDEEVHKEQSLLEEKAYRDTWGHGIESYLSMLGARLSIAREMLTEDGSIYVHIGPNINHLVRSLMDEVFGWEHFQREIIWQRVTARSHGDYYPATHDYILFYTRFGDPRSRLVPAHRF